MGHNDRFKDTFFLECEELIARLELYLGALEGSSRDTEQLQSAFRAIHSIKGGAGMFRFARLVAFAHVFEGAIDHLWKGRAVADRDCVAKLVHATDVLADLVGEARTGVLIGEELIRNAIDQLRAIAASHDAFAAPAAKMVAPTAPAPNPAGGARTYEIRFEPNSDMFRRAIEPLSIIRALRELGRVDVALDSSGLPSFSCLDPTAAYFRWRLRLETEATPARVGKVFEFAAGSCTYDIVDLSAAGVMKPASVASAVAETEDKECAKEAAPEPRNDRPAEVTLPAATAAAPLSVGISGSTPPAERPSLIGQDRTPLPSIERRVTSIRVDLDRVDRLVNLVGEIAIVQAMVLQQLDRVAVGSNPHLMRLLNQLEQHTRNLQDSVMGIRAQPVRSIFGRMPRVVREVSQYLGKSVELEISGEDTEIDKTIIEELSTPLVQLIRNAVDHGIEPPEERRRLGKPEQGKIRLSAARQGSRIVIQVSDDGRGIDRAKVRLRAIERGLISSEAGLSDEEVENLALTAGFSTAESVSKISGRGVGMDIVTNSIEKLGGRVSLSSKPGAGTTAVLILPLTLAVLDGMVVRAGPDRYVVPLGNTLECLVSPVSAVRDVPGTGCVVSVRGAQLPLVSLAGAAGWDVGGGEGSLEIVVVESEGGARIGLAVAEIIGQQQVVVKSVRENYEDLPGVAGATILGDGTVALILDVAETAARPGARSSCRKLLRTTDQPGDHAA